MGVSPLTRQMSSASAKMSPSGSSSVSNSSSISPTICSITSSKVTRPAVRPNSSTTMAMWLRVARNSRSSACRSLFSGTKSGGRTRVRRFSSGARASLSRSLASRMPMMFSRPPCTTGKRECAVRITCSTSCSRSVSMSSTSMRGAATRMSAAVISAICSTRSSMTREAVWMTALSSASASVAISSSVVSGRGWRNSTSRCKSVRLSSLSGACAGLGSDTWGVR